MRKNYIFDQTGLSYRKYTFMQQEQVEIGKKKLRQATLIVCGIVRNCAQGLAKHIPAINLLCDIAKEYHVIIFENDSTDDTKQILSDWQRKRKNIHISLNDFGTTTIPIKDSTSNRFFSKYRIEKMAKYRNQYLNYISENEIVGDYVIVLDLDVKKISVSGILHSLGSRKEWDCIAANGYIYSPSAWFRKRYNDGYALVECGMENIAQTEQEIKRNQYKWAFMKTGMPFIPVFSAFGGGAIYRYEAIKNCRYSTIPNHDERVEVRCEHYSLCKQMSEQGFSKIFINPSMTIKYEPYIYQKIRRTLTSSHGK